MYGSCYSELNLFYVQVYDGGLFTYQGDSTAGDFLTLNIEEDFTVDGGGIVEGNKIVVNAETILIKVDGIVRANGMGYPAGFGPGVGLNGTDLIGGSGASYGGLGGQGLAISYASAAYGNCLEPSNYGSGGALMEEGQTDASGGGVINLYAITSIEIDGQVMADGADATTPGAGGGSGGSVVAKAPVIKGTTFYK